MSYSLAKQWIFFGVTCDTASDIVLALDEARTQGEDVFLQTLIDAMSIADEDIICGHIDRFRVRLGKKLMDSNERDSLMEFFFKFRDSKSSTNEELAWEFISEAVDEHA